MSKIGFKFSGEKKERIKRVKEETPIITHAMLHIAETEAKVNEIETFMTTASFTRMNKAQKYQTISMYRFLVTSLALINSPVTGLSECAAMDTIGFVD